MREDQDKLSNYITRDMYRRIKSMNREDMCEFLYNLYNSIYEEHSNNNKPDYDSIWKQVQTIHGIGEVKATQIVEVVKECIEGDK